MRCGDVGTVFGAKHVLQQDFEAVRKGSGIELGHIEDAVLLTRYL
jgi:hypothetical protein